ncbi:MAG: nucleotidyl transferase AbiEii/AbiGii toxin family protein, partial [Acidimicrobiia bacterium]|nr:nucleotidyl transferase AbiEii/AbiGii toxin family protein [Acidimicrobiia bacterium]
LRELWPLAAVLARKTSGRLMGGTALALHLRHRASEDLDIMTLKDFSGRSLRQQMHKHLDKAFPAGHTYNQELLTSEQRGYFAVRLSSGSI